MDSKLISLNKISSSQKHVFFNRLLIAVLLFTYWIVIFVTCLLADNSPTSEWYIDLDVKYKGIAAYLFILLLVPFIYGASLEINKLFFGYHMRKTFILLFISILVLCILPNFTFITKYYYFSSDEINPNISESFSFNTIFFLFTLTLVFSFIFLIIILTIIVKMKGVSDLATLLLFFILTIGVSFGFFSIGFIGLLKSWLTLFFIMAITSFTDIFAYLSGMVFGKRKISKIISPKKTIEGFFIGLFITICCGLLLTYFISFGEERHNSFENIIHVDYIYNNEYGRWFFILFLIISLSLISSIGDLTFSYIKRKYGIKDYGDFFQNHGGILDRFDSSLFTCSFYSIFIFFLSGLTESKLFG